MRRKARKVTPDMIDIMKMLRKSGKTIEYIAEAMDISSTTVYKHTQDVQMKTIRENILEMLEDGEKPNKITSKLNCRLGYVYQLSSEINGEKQDVEIVKLTNKPMLDRKQEIAAICKRIEDERKLKEQEFEQQRQLEIANCRWGGTHPI